MKKILALFIGCGCVLTLAFFSSLVYSTIGAETKQLKEPKQPKVVSEEKLSDSTAAKAEAQKKPGTEQEHNQIITMPTEGNSSYSVVIENRRGPDGKTIRTKKVWQNGKLIEDSEDVVENTTDEAATITLPDGGSVPGSLLRSEQFSDIPDDLFLGNPAEIIKKFEEKMRLQQQRQAEEMKRFFSNSPSSFSFGQVPQDQIKLSEYWMGASIQVVPDVLAAQLALPEGEGVLVLNVLPNSPAEKAGLKRYDVIVTLDGVKLTDGSMVGQIIDKNKDKTIKVEYFRGGQKKTLDLTPAKRPAAIESLPLDTTDANKSGQRQSIRVVRPGMIVPADQFKQEQKQESKKEEK